ncbi:MAG: hypothetical protein HXX14_21780 [Bacteroidetes bacterium]|nr:hypothetical protein [Bacteroidota bacterium]NWJ53476.1 hypothetical protein [Bacteroidota bacterium]
MILKSDYGYMGIVELISEYELIVLEMGIYHLRIKVFAKNNLYFAYYKFTPKEVKKTIFDLFLTMI